MAATYSKDGVAAVAVDVAELLGGGRREVVLQVEDSRRGGGRRHYDDDGRIECISAVASYPNRITPRSTRLRMYGLRASFSFLIELSSSCRKKFVLEIEVARSN